MTSWITYQDKSLGRIKLNDNNTNKFVFIAESLEDLVTLFRINPDEEIELEGRGKISYKGFKEELKNISAFYPTMNDWILKNERSKTIEEYEKNSSSQDL